MKKDKIYLTILLAIVCLISAIAVNKKLSETWRNQRGGGRLPKSGFWIWESGLVPYL